MTIEGEHYRYRELSLSDFVNQYQTSIPQARLFELTLPWLSATAKYMVAAQQKVIVHCLYKCDEDLELLIAWPLVHDNAIKKISSLTSFYSAIAEPIFVKELGRKAFKYLIHCIEEKFCWQSMLLGPFDDPLIEQSLNDYFPFQRVYSETDNIFQANIADYQAYFQQRPSQLRNTIKRREKKLNKAHEYRTEIITTLEHFSAAFDAYKTIYQQSWKGDEYSYAFIKQVCLAALAENKLRLGLLWVDEEPAAAQLWFLQPSNDDNKLTMTASIFKLAYSPKYQQFSVGSLLSLALSEHVISLDKVNSIEFGMGSESYKTDWLGSVRTRKSFQIFNHQTLYGKLAIVRHLLLARLINLFTRNKK